MVGGDIAGFATAEALRRTGHKITVSGASQVDILKAILILSLSWWKSHPPSKKQDI
jgi:2-polyprenyl-6-methoxyphenol hydroxylase-like FAD-dependent oxidoreductase